MNEESVARAEETVKPEPQARTKFCRYCGAKIPEAAVICTACGCQVEELKHQEQPQVIINNSNTSSNVNTNTNVVAAGALKKEKNKWVAFLLCLFLGCLGVHKFYEGKVGMGILYLFTAGLFGIGWIVDCILLLCKPNPYYV